MALVKLRPLLLSVRKPHLLKEYSDHSHE